MIARRAGASAVGRRLTPTLAHTYALLLLGQIGWLAIVPLLPEISRRLHLSDIEAAAVLSSVSLAAIGAAPLFGWAAGRVSGGLLLRLIAAVLVVACVGQALAPNFWALLLFRGLFGVGYAGIWTAGPSLIATTTTTMRVSAALAATEAVAAVGFFVAPAFAGAVAAHWGLAWPFLLVAAATAPFALAAPDVPRVEEPFTPNGMRAGLAASLREPHLMAGFLALVLVGATNGGVSLLVPLAFAGHGASSQTIGLILSLGALGYAVVCVAVIRPGDRLATPAVAAWAAAVYGGVTVIVLFGDGFWNLAAFTLARSPAFAVLTTIAFPLAALGARRARIATGQAMAAYNVAWGLASVAGPPATGAIAHAAGVGAGFLLLFVFSLLVAGALAATALRPSARLAVYAEVEV